MSTDWTEHLQKLGAQFDASGRIHFPATAWSATTADAICVLHHTGVIRVSGDDAKTFLQGQFSNDVTAVDPAHAQLTSWCSPKGRVLAVFTLFQIGGDYFLLIPKSLIATTLKRLQLFVMRSKVNLSDESSTRHCLGLIAPNQATLSALARLIGPSPEPPYAAATQAPSALLRVHDAHSQARFVLCAPAEWLLAHWPEIHREQSTLGDAAWEWFDIQSGIPSVYPGSTDEFVPQMLNLDLIGGVSFKKGCYPGQEIVARTHYLGKVKRRLFKIHGALSSPPAPGTDLLSKNAQAIGKIVQSAPHPQQGYDALAVIQREEAEQQNPLFLPSPEPSVIQVHSLPYPLDLPE